MVGCPACASMEDCAKQQDPFALYGQHCLDMPMMGCAAWSTFCASDAAGPNGTTGAAYATECIEPTVPVAPTPAPAPTTKSPCLKDPLARNWCKFYK